MDKKILLAIDSSGWRSFFQLITVLLIFLLVLVLTYFTTKWIAKYQKGMTTDKNITVIETFRVTNNKFIQIIKVGEVYLVIAVGKDSINLLAQMEKEQLTWLPEESEQVPAVNENFQEILNKLKEKLPRK